MNKLNSAEAAHEAARQALAEAVAEAERIAERLAAGDETVTVAEAMEAPAAVKVAEARLTAATNKLRAVEDGQPLPEAPAVRLTPEAAAAGDELIAATKAARAAESALTKATDQLARAEAKAVTAGERLAAGKAGDIRAAVHLANLLTSAGVAACHVEIATEGAEQPRRSTLPVLRLTPGRGRRVKLRHYGRFDGDGVPNAEGVALALSLDGWRGAPGAWDREDTEDGVTHSTILDIEPRAIAAWAESEDVNGEPGTDLLDHAGEALHWAMAVLRGERRSMKTYTSTGRVPLALHVDEDGLHRVTVGLAVAICTTSTQTLHRGAEKDAMAEAWRSILGATDWNLGVATDVQPLTGTPSWAAEVPLDVRGARDTVVHYAEVSTAFRVAEGRTVRTEMFGSSCVAA